MDVEALVAELVGEAPRSGGDQGLTWLVSSVSKDATRDEALRLIEAMDRPWVVPDHLGRPLQSFVILVACGRHPEPAFAWALARVEESVPVRSRQQLVRSVLEVGIRADDQDVVELGLDMARRMVDEGVSIHENEDPLYWLYRAPKYPHLVLPRLGHLAGGVGWRSQAERTRLAYRSAFPSADSEPSYVSGSQLEEWARNGDRSLVQVVVDHVEATDTAHLSDLLATVWSTWMVEAEVLNGGFNQYFWNSSGQWAHQAEDGFARLGAMDLQALMADARSRYSLRRAELQALRDSGSLEAFSESYELAAFDDLDQRFATLTETKSVELLLLEWLSDKTADLAAELSASDPTT